MHSKELHNFVPNKLSERQTKDLFSKDSSNRDDKSLGKGDRSNGEDGSKSSPNVKSSIFNVTNTSTSVMSVTLKDRRRGKGKS